MSITKVDWLSIRTAHEEAQSAKEASEHAKAARTGAKDALEDERQTIDELQQELAEKYADAAPAGEDAKRLMNQCKAVMDAAGRYEMADRRHRQANHHAAEMVERFFQVVGEIAGNEGTLGFEAADTTRNGPDAYKRVELRNLIGELQALPFEKVGIRLVGDAELAVREKTLGPRVSAGEFTEDQAAYVRMKVIELLNRLGINHALGDIDPRTSEKFTIAPPEVPKPAKPAAAAAEGDDAGVGPEGDAEGADDEDPYAEYPVPDDVERKDGIPLRIVHPGRPDFAADPARKMLESTWYGLYTTDKAACAAIKSHGAWNTAVVARNLQHIMTRFGAPTLGHLVVRFETIFDQKWLKDINLDLEALNANELNAVLEVMGNVMHRTGSPVLYGLTDAMKAKHEEVFDDLVSGLDLAKIAARPEDQRYGRENSYKFSETTEPFAGDPEKANNRKASKTRKAKKDTAGTT